MGEKERGPVRETAAKTYPQCDPCMQRDDQKLGFQEEILDLEEPGQRGKV